MSRNYSKTKQIGKKRPTYKKNRKSTKGKSKYEIYQEHRQRLKEQGYTVDEGLTKEEFMEQYEAAQLRHDKNIVRDIARDDIIFSKTKRTKKVIPALEELKKKGITVSGIEYGPSGITVTEQFDRLEWFRAMHMMSEEGMLDKEQTKKVKDDTKRGWHYLWEEDFYRGSVFY